MYICNGSLTSTHTCTMYMYMYMGRTILDLYIHVCVVDKHTCQHMCIHMRKSVSIFGLPCPVFFLQDIYSSTLPLDYTAGLQGMRYILQSPRACYCTLLCKMCTCYEHVHTPRVCMYMHYGCVRCRSHTCTCIYYVVCDKSNSANT